MGRFNRIEEVEAWKTSRLLVREVYSAVRNGPMKRDFGFRDQLCRATVSVMNNVAEGVESGSKKNFVRYLHCAKASAGEVRSMLYAAHDLGYVSSAQFQRLACIAERASRQVARLAHYLKNDQR